MGRSVSSGSSRYVKYKYGKGEFPVGATCHPDRRYARCATKEHRFGGLATSGAGLSCFNAVALVEAQDKAATLSLPRGNGKSFLAAHIVTRALTPGDELFVDGKEIVQCAASIEQARIVFNFVRLALEPTGAYRFIDSVTRLGCTHRETN